MIRYEVRMHRPDRKRVVVRVLYSEQPIDASSDRQLAGYLTHKLFGDGERGGEGTHYTIKESGEALLKVFTIVKRGLNYLHA